MFGLFSWRRRARKLRKHWDRCREKALKKREPARSMALQKLDMISPALVTLEERQVGRIERERIMKELEIALAEVKAIIKSKQDELQNVKYAGPQ